MFKLEISTDNDAFSIDQGAEVARILRRLADDLDTGRDNACTYGSVVRDANGARVGTWTLDAHWTTTQ